ncbi:MAG: hypothetical protein KatS3mg114_0703 [Planctomycetaceae bacterium]|nr:MAG: hypothetical protein KatS3mg114_0703 [Planctomycetaceae bacterium]
MRHTTIIRSLLVLGALMTGVKSGQAAGPTTHEQLHAATAQHLSASQSAFWHRRSVVRSYVSVRPGLYYSRYVYRGPSWSYAPAYRSTVVYRPYYTYPVGYYRYGYYAYPSYYNFAYPYYYGSYGTVAYSYGWPGWGYYSSWGYASPGWGISFGFGW